MDNESAAFADAVGVESDFCIGGRKGHDLVCAALAHVKFNRSFVLDND